MNNRQDTQIGAQGVPEGQCPGVPCPNCCNFQFKVSIVDLLYGESVSCPVCGLVMTPDRAGSGRLMELLRDVHNAERNVELLKKQSL
ncbi:MAG: hypothetical protein GY719_28265 [bacterium]|nr:hypothetical protein [bacterium]